MKSLKILARSFLRFSTSDPSIYSAALSYYIFFAIAPTLFIILAVLGLVIDVTAANDYVSSFLAYYTTPDIVSYVLGIMDAMSNRALTLSALFIGIIIVFFGLFQIVKHLFGVVRHIWGDTYENRHMTTPVKSFAAIVLALLAIGFFFFGSIIVGTIYDLFILRLLQTLPAIAAYSRYFDILLVVTVLFLMLLTIMKYLVPKRVTWAQVSVGAGISSVLLYVLKYAFELYLKLSGITSIYGAASTLVIFLVWLQLMSTVFIFGLYTIYVAETMES